MNIREIDGLDAIRPLNVVDYLRSHGWVDSGTSDRTVAVYQRLTERGEVKARVLLDDTFSDFAVRMAEVADTISRVESRPLLAVVNDLLSPPGDALRFRIDSESSEAGTLSLHQSLQLRKGLRNLLLAAAHSALIPQPHFARLSQAKAVELVNACCERQSERGSYVASILVPVVPPVGQLTLDEEFGRRTTKTLFSALQRAERSAANPDLLMGEFQHGVSANFLDALADIEPEGQRSAVEVSVNWLRGAPERDFDRAVRLPQTAFRNFRSVARALRERTPLQNTELEGYIIAVSREVDEPTGRATLTTIVEPLGETRVKVELDANQYAAALDAHRDGQRVRVVGTLKKVGRGHVLEQHSGFEVVADDR
ncbi:MAG: hypothetical protein ABTQ32_08355 [Myxococcaceae bacterium]